MTRERFELFWNAWSSKWYNETSIIASNGESLKVSSLCRFEDSAMNDIYDEYCKQKDKAKRDYFKKSKNNKKDPNALHLSRYKRAAVLTYAVILASPFCYNDKSTMQNQLDPYLLKQRFAFFFALASIIQEFPPDVVEECLKSKKTIFEFAGLGKTEWQNGEDDFELSMYKDLLFAEFYGNYNILTMANVYGLLTECCSYLPVNPA